MSSFKYFEKMTGQTEEELIKNKEKNYIEWEQLEKIQCLGYGKNGKRCTRVNKVKKYCHLHNPEDEEQRQQQRIEAKECKKLYKQQYCEKNREKINENRRQNYQNNKEQKQQQMKQYREENKEKLNEYKRQHGAVIIECECGQEIRTDCLRRHMKTGKHFSQMLEQQQLLQLLIQQQE